MTTKTTRKLIALGGTLMVGLPHEWLNSWKMSKGDSVELVTDPANTIIIIRPVRTEVKEPGKK
jgi:antitoxin component of MazEF toxin-antitoxin module